MAYRTLVYVGALGFWRNTRSERFSAPYVCPVGDVFHLVMQTISLAELFYECLRLSMLAARRMWNSSIRLTVEVNVSRLQGWIKYLDFRTRTRA